MPWSVHSGKTTLLQVLADSSSPPASTVPTVGMNVRTAKRGNVKMKLWDLGGQRQYRGEWVRYTSGCDCIVFVVDAFDVHRIGEAKKELHVLLDEPSLATTPILVVANKIDLEPHLRRDELIHELNLDYITESRWAIQPISALRRTNIMPVIEWLTAKGK